MSFSYNPSLNRGVDQARFLVQDTVESTAEFQDEELLWLITNTGSVGQAAVAAARTAFARYAKQVNKTVGDLSIQYAQKAANWKLMLDALEQNAWTLSPTSIYVGGLNPDDKTTDDQDENLVQPQFSTGDRDSIGPGGQVPVGDPGEQF
jgi:hypothetical protein